MQSVGLHNYSNVFDFDVRKTNLGLNLVVCAVPAVLRLHSVISLSLNRSVD